MWSITEDCSAVVNRKDSYDVRLNPFGDNDNDELDEESTESDPQPAPTVSADSTVVSSETAAIPAAAATVTESAAPPSDVHLPSTESSATTVYWYVLSFCCLYSNFTNWCTNWIWLLVFYFGVYFTSLDTDWCVILLLTNICQLCMLSLGWKIQCHRIIKFQVDVGLHFYLVIYLLCLSLDQLFIFIHNTNYM